MTTETRPARARNGGFWLLPLGLFCLAAAMYMVSAYLPPEVSTSRVPIHSTVQFVLLLGHIFFAAVALIVGTAQFWPWLRGRHPRVHRWIGRVYLFVGVFPGAVFAIPVVFTAELGLSTQLGLAVVDIAWLVTAVRAYRAVRQRRFADHRVWMMRNFALTLSPVVFRVVQLPSYLLVVLEQPDIARSTAMHDVAGTSIWFALVANLAFVEYRIHRTAQRSRAITSPIAAMDGSSTTT